MNVGSVMTQTGAAASQPVVDQNPVVSNNLTGSPQQQFLQKLHDALVQHAPKERESQQFIANLQRLLSTPIPDPQFTPVEQDCINAYNLLHAVSTRTGDVSINNELLVPLYPFTQGARKAWDELKLKHLEHLVNQAAQDIIQMQEALYPGSALIGNVLASIVTLPAGTTDLTKAKTFLEEVLTEIKKESPQLPADAQAKFTTAYNVLVAAWNNAQTPLEKGHILKQTQELLPFTTDAAAAWRKAFAGGLTNRFMTVEATNTSNLKEVARLNAVVLQLQQQADPVRNMFNRVLQAVPAGADASQWEAVTKLLNAQGDIRNAYCAADQAAMQQAVRNLLAVALPDTLECLFLTRLLVERDKIFDWVGSDKQQESFNKFQTIQTAKEEHRKLEGEKQQLETDLTAVQAEVKSLQDETPKLGASITALREELLERETKIASLEQEAADKISKLEEITNCAKGLKDERDELEAKIEALDQEATDQSTAQAGVQAKTGAEVAEFQGQIASLGSEKAELEARIELLNQEAKSEVAAQAKVKESLDAGLAKLQEEIVGLEENQRTTKEAFTVAQQQGAASEKEIAELQTQVSSLETEKVQLEAAIATAQQQKQGLEGQVEQLATGLANVQQQLAAKSVSKTPVRRAPPPQAGTPEGVKAVRARKQKIKAQQAAAGSGVDENAENLAQARLDQVTAYNRLIQTEIPAGLRKLCCAVAGEGVTIEKQKVGEAFERMCQELYLAKDVTERNAIIDKYLGDGAFANVGGLLSDGGLGDVLPTVASLQKDLLGDNWGLEGSPIFLTQEQMETFESGQPYMDDPQKSDRDVVNEVACLEKPFTQVLSRINRALELAPLSRLLGYLSQPETKGYMKTLLCSSPAETNVTMNRGSDANKLPEKCTFRAFTCRILEQVNALNATD